MIYPKFIKEKDTIGIPAPSSGAYNQKKKNKFLNAKQKLEDLDFKLILSEYIMQCDRGRSANAEDRAKEVNKMFQDKQIDMILCATGGDFLMEILPHINFDLLVNNPKFVVGFSDPTGILFPITTKYDIATIYGHNFSSLGIDEYHKSEKDFIEILKGNLIKQESYDMYEEESPSTITGTEGYNLTETVKWKTLDDNSVTVKGRIIGGCLDVISLLAGTKYDGVKEFNEKYKEDGIIWYFDNCELSKEETIRVLWKFHELEYFKYTKGIIFGRFGTNTTCYDYDVKGCLQDSVLNGLNIPIIYDADISHKSPCLTIINGALAEVYVANNKGTITFKLDKQYVK